jgi:hypothetical protein
VVDAICTLLQAAEYEDEPVFGLVSRWDITDWDLAVRELAVYQDRVALVIVTDTEWESLSGDEQFAPYLRCKIGVSVIVSDRRIGARQDSVWGGDNNIGSIQLGQIAVDALTGHLSVDVPDVRCRPVSGRSFQITEEGSGRKARAIDFMVEQAWEQKIA